MLGPNASEVIHEAAMGLHFHATLDDFIDLLHVYPTMAEALKIVAISRYKDPARLSCCAEYDGDPCDAKRYWVVATCRD
jgi:mercuric reductase